jgi:hypothetical protein
LEIISRRKGILRVSSEYFHPRFVQLLRLASITPHSHTSSHNFCLLLHIFHLHLKKADLFISLLFLYYCRFIVQCDIESAMASLTEHYLFVLKRWKKKYSFCLRSITMSEYLFSASYPNDTNSSLSSRSKHVGVFRERCLQSD